MSGALIPVAVLVGWLVCGYLGGIYWARVSYLGSRKRWSILGEDTHRESAIFAMIFSLIAGPMALLAVPAWAAVHRGIDSIPEVKAQNDRARIAKLEADLDAAHRELGIAPLRRSAS